MMTGSIVVTLEKASSESENVHEMSLITLRRDLRELGILAKNFDSPAPRHTRAIDSETLNTLAMIIAPAGATLTAALKIILDWLERREGRSAVITKDGEHLHLRGLSRENLDGIVQEWIKQTP